MFVSVCQFMKLWGGGYRQRGVALLIVETEVNRDSKRTNERGSVLVGSLGLSCLYKRFLFCLSCSSRPGTKYFFPHRTLVQFICLHRLASCKHIRTFVASVLWEKKSRRFSYMYTAKLAPVGSKYITPARVWIIISYEDKDQNQT